MRIEYKKLAALAATVLVIPSLSFAAPTAKQKTISGTVTRIYGNEITFKTTSAALYSAETSQAALARKNGAAMNFGEILAGDKVEVKGLLWPDGSMNAAYVRNMSLYPHTGTFSGKIAAVDSLNSRFTLQSKQYGTQIIHTDAFTTFKKNSASVTLRDLAPGFSATVKGIWDRDNKIVAAKSVQATVRLISIDVTGALVMKGPGSLTITANNVIYGVDIGGARLQSKNSKSLPLSQVNLGDTLRVQGQHISEGTQITASLVKDLSVIK